MPDQPAEQSERGQSERGQSERGQPEPVVDGVAVFPEDEEWVPPPEPSDEELAGLCPDPDTDPPDGDAAWLADLAVPQLDALATELAAARPAATESLWAGFTHRRAAAGIAAGEIGWDVEIAAPAPAGPAIGLAAGGPLDLAPPGPVLADFAQQIVDGGLASLSDDELIGLLCAARRMASWQAATELTAVAELAARRSAGVSASLVSSEVDEHVAAELAAALTLTGRAADDLLCLAFGLARLVPVHAALSTGMIDLAKARVFAAELSAIGDVAAKLIALRFLDRAPGWTTGQLRRALRAAVLAADPESGKRRAAAARDDTRVEAWQEGSGNGALSGRELPAAETIAADARISEIARALKDAGAAGTMDQLRADAYLALLLGKDPFELLPDSARRDARGCESPPAAATAGPGGVINLTLPALTWLGLADHPGEVAGLGPVDPFTGRDLSGMLAARGSTAWHVTLTNGAGQAVAHACARGQPPMCRARPGSSRRGPPGSSDPRIDWLAGLKFDWLERGTCQHPRQTPAYQPGKALRHLLAIRNPTCVFPGCRRPARQCDNEHTVPFDAGGRTCECNCAPVCRRHHRVKQVPGWHLAQPEPGVLVWTTPSGREYVTRPDSYLV